MQLELQMPYASLYRKGYVRTGRDGRKRVDLFNSDADRTTVSYARYLLSVKIGRLLADDEEADHIDSDRSKDDIDNLQVLAIPEHRRKSSSERKPRTFVQLQCSVCGVPFSRERRQVKPGPQMCSKKCCGRARRKLGVAGSIPAAVAISTEGA